MCGDGEFVIWRGLADIPAYDEDLERLPPPLRVAALRHEIGRSDAVLIATPEYNGSIPGALKNALDWVSRPFATNVLRNKRVAVVGASTGLFGAVRAQAELRNVLAVIGANVLETGLLGAKRRQGVRRPSVGCATPSSGEPCARSSTNWLWTRLHAQPDPVS